MKYMKRATGNILILLISFAMQAAIPAGYYDSATGTGYTLKTQLHNIIDDHTVVSYDALWTHFQSTDVDNYYENDGSVLDMYSENPAGTDPYEFTFVSNQCGTYSVEGDCYNREHSWPKSWFNDASPMYSDIFHLYPTDGKVNGMRSNWPFGETNAPTWTSQNGSKLGPSAYPGYTGTVFEPLDEFKGDFARSYFYMATRYEDVISGWPGCDMLDGSADKVFTDWALNMLIDWHNADPVSQKEIDRNDLIYTNVQHNRNPFIDHPEYVNYIWGGAAPVPSVNFVTTSQQVEESAGSLGVYVSISQAIPDDVTANFTVTGTASNGSDYTLSQNYVLFPASATVSQYVTLTITDDTEPEDFESIIITIDNLVTDNTEIIIGNSDEIIFTINNNDGYDATPPYIYNHILLNDSTLVLDFSENMDPVTTETLTNYVVDNSVGNPLSALLGYEGDSSKVELSFPVFSSGINYQLTINNVEDPAGNTIAANTTVNFAVSSGGGNGWIEYFEDATFSSYYTGTVTYPTGDWDLVNVYLEPASEAYEGEHAVRMNDDTAGASVTTPAINGVDSVIFYYRALNSEASSSTFWLQKSVDDGAYTNVQSQAFQASTYSQFAYKVNDTSDNIKLRVLNDNQAGHLIIDCFKVVTFSVPAPDTTPPTITGHEISGTDIIISFDEELDPATSESVINYVLDNGGDNPSAAVLGYLGDPAKVVLSYPSFIEDVTYTLTINNVEDLAGNPVAAGSTVQFIINSTGGGGGESWIEDFELANWGTYSTGTFTLSTGDWDIVDVYPETSSSTSYEGSHAVRLNDDSNNSSITAPAVNGVDSVIFYFRTLNQEAAVSTFWLQKSVDGGAYTNITSQPFQNNTYAMFAHKVNDASDNIRLRILSDQQSGHLIVDYFKVVTFPVNLNSPANVSTVISGSDITLSWDAVTGALSYDVYSSDLPYDGFAWEATVTVPEYTTSCSEAKKFYYILASDQGTKKIDPKISHERFIEIK